MQSNQSLGDGEIPEFVARIKNWKDEPKNTIKNVLVRIHTTVTWNETQNALNKLLDALRGFHRQINKASKESPQDIEEEWFELVIKGKNHLEMLLKQQKKPGFANRKLKARFHQIKVPQLCLEQKALQQSLVFQLLYKSFLTNLKETIAHDVPKITEFLNKVVQCLFNQFNFGKQKHNDCQQNTKRMFDRLESIQKEFKTKSSSLSKEEMLEGSISPMDTAKCNPIIFFEQEVKRRRNKRLKNGSSTN